MSADRKGIALNAVRRETPAGVPRRFRCWLFITQQVPLAADLMNFPLEAGADRAR
jgi:hypothetical protein